MKVFRILTLLIVFMTGALIIWQKASAQQDSVNFRLFYAALSPYGTWVEYPSYGYVWMPKGYPGFTPYGTAGHWTITDDGWTWASDYPWGWAPFHYGRWDFDNVNEWFWVPGYEWGPAWVLWKRSPDHYGWTPLRPGDSMSIAFGSDFYGRDERWKFVDEKDMSIPDTIRRAITRTKNITIINRSKIIKSTQNKDRRNAANNAGSDRSESENLQDVSAKDR